EGEGRGYTINLPLSAGARPGDYAAAFDRVILPILEEYGPEIVLVSAGFDAHKADPPAALLLDASAYRWMARAPARIADQSAGGKMALLLEGGYDLAALEASLADTLASLASPGRETRDVPSQPSAIHEAEIQRARTALREHWRAVR